MADNSPDNPPLISLMLIITANAIHLNQSPKKKHLEETSQTHKHYKLKKYCCGYALTCSLFPFDFHDFFVKSRVYVDWTEKKIKKRALDLTKVQFIRNNYRRCYLQALQCWVAVERRTWIQKICRASLLCVCGHMLESHTNTHRHTALTIDITFIRCQFYYNFQYWAHTFHIACMRRGWCMFSIYPVDTQCSCLFLPHTSNGVMNISPFKMCVCILSHYSVECSIFVGFTSLALRRRFRSGFPIRIFLPFLLLRL